MSTVITYANNERQCFCQIRFENGERILVGMAGRPTPSFLVTKLVFFGFIPLQTVWKLTPEMTDNSPVAYVQKLLSMFDARNESGKLKHPLDAARDVFLGCESISDVRREIAARYSK